ncbi:MAG: hypothetical protein AAF907_08415, partial [Planctomycetota bacterium]
MAAENAVVKLHGEAQDTRADLTLDEEPSEDDAKTFADYLTRGAGHPRGYDGGGRDAMTGEAKRLLVLGYSGSDHRVVQMIKKWLEDGPGRPVVYWVAYSKSDVDWVRELFKAPEYRGQLLLTQTARPDLLLLSLYQRLALALPPGGLNYSFTQSVPPQRRKSLDYADLPRRLLELVRSGRPPVAAARSLLGGIADLEEPQRLLRDGSALDLKELLVRVASTNPEKLQYQRAGRYEPVRSRAGSALADLWLPIYRMGPVAEDRKSRRSEEEFQRVRKYVPGLPALVESHGGVVRATALAAKELTAKRNMRVFWFETIDYLDADSLLRDLLRTLAGRFGSFQSRHTIQHPFPQSLLDTARDYLKAHLVKNYDPDWKRMQREEYLGRGWSKQKADSETDKKTEGRIKPIVDRSPASWSRGEAESAWIPVSEKLAAHLQEVLLDYRADAGQIVIFLYGRDSYGSCSGLIARPWWDAESGKSDETKPNQHAFAGLHCLIEALGRAGLRVIYFPLTKSRADRKATFEKRAGLPTGPLQGVIDPSTGSKRFVDWKSWQNRADLSSKWPHDCFVTQRGKEHLDALGPAEDAAVFGPLIRRVLRPLFKPDGEGGLVPAEQAIDEGQRRWVLFLYAMTLFRHSRPITALASEAVVQCVY